MSNTETPPELDATRCPVSGLPIHRRPEWTDLPLGNRYRFSTALIGDRIIFNQPVGHATEATLRKALSLTDEACAASIPPDLTYVHLSDYRRVRNVSPAGRKYFLTYILAKNRLSGFIIFGASPLLRIVIKLGQKLSRKKALPVFVVRTYGEAIRKALELLGTTVLASNGRGAGDTEGYQSNVCLEDPNQVRQRVERGHLVLSAPHWRIERKDFWVQNEVIDHQILHIRISGVMKADDINQIDALRRCIRREIGLDKGFPVMIANVARLRYNNRGTRQRSMQVLKAWHKQYPIELYIFSNPSRWIKAAVALARPFMPFRVRLADNLEAALVLAEGIHRRPSRLSRIERLLQKPGASRRREIEAYRDQLLHYLGDIDWEKDGSPKPPTDPGKHVMGPVFEAIALLKAELDEVFAERNTMADALKKSQQRFEEVLAHSRDMLFKRDVTNGKYDYISAAAKELLGYSADEIRDMGIEGVTEQLHPEDRDRFRSFCTGLISSEEDLPREHAIEYRFRHKDGRYIWLSDSHAILRDETGRPTHVIGSNRDIQRFKAMEAERLRMAKRLQRSGKLEAISTLAGGIAHNFNNLLMTILGNAEMTRMQLPAESEINPRIDAIQKAADRAAELSTLMLTYVGQGKMSFDALDLAVLAGEMAQVLKTSLPKADQLGVVTSNAQTRIAGDPGKIGQVITDIVTNAIEATAEEARQITLKTGRRHCDAAFFEKRVTYETLPPGEYVYLEVTDNGAGMDTQTLEKVFDPFFTTKFTGRGLGLAAAVGVIRAHRGTIALSSNPRRGTSVTLLFPPAAAPTAVRQVRPTGTPPHPEAGNTVLLVDDEPMVIEVGEMMLEAIGFDIITAKDGIEALELLSRHRQEISLVILDLTMPRKDGFDTFRDMQRMAPEIPVIIATGYTRGQVRQQFGDTPPAAYLKKPFRMDHLAETIRGVLSAPEGPSHKPS
jgi:PAS domain S-box-containing protein